MFSKILAHSNNSCNFAPKLYNTDAECVLHCVPDLRIINFDEGDFSKRESPIFVTCHMSHVTLVGSHFLN